MNYDPEQSHPEFESNLRNSTKATAILAAWLSSKGRTVTIPGICVRPDVSQRMDYQDNGDLIVGKSVEVKHRPDLHFTSKENYPYETVFVDEAYKIDGGQNKDLYAIINGDMTGCLWIDCKKTRKQWVTIEKPDKGRLCSFYACPRECCAFERFDW